MSKFSDDKGTHLWNGDSIIIHDRRLPNSSIQHCNRIMMLELKASYLFDTIYAPTAHKIEDSIKNSMNNKANDRTQNNLEDFNVKIVARIDEEPVRSFNLDIRNDKSDRSVEYCREKESNVRISFY